MLRILALLLAVSLGFGSAAAQQVTNPLPNAGVYGAYNSSAPTCVTGTGCWIQTDINGNLKVVIGSGGGTQNVAITSPLGGGVQATAVRTTLATDSPGIIPLGQAVKASSAPVVVASDQLGPQAVANAFPFTLSSQYPTNATTTTPTAVTATATGTTAATAASLGATASVTNFVCGFTITADATALATGTATLSGTISGSLNYLQTILALTSGASVLTQNFNPCIPASAANTAITITSAAAGTGGNTIVNIWGYRL